MKQKTIFTCILFVMCLAGHAQKSHKTKCKLVHDKELDVDVYKDADCSEGIAGDSLFNELAVSKEFRFKPVTKTCPEGQRVTIGCRIDANGKAIFIKVLTPVNDKEIKNEAKRIVSLFPPYKPCKCNGEPVPSVAKITMPLISKRKE